MGTCKSEDTEALTYTQCCGPQTETHHRALEPFNILKKKLAFSVLRKLPHRKMLINYLQHKIQCTTDKLYKMHFATKAKLKYSTSKTHRSSFLTGNFTTKMSDIKLSCKT